MIMHHLPEGSRNTIIVACVILTLAWIAVSLRFYTRWITKAGIASDDWWILVGIILSLITGSTLLFGIMSDPDGGAMINRDSPTFDYGPHVIYLKVSLATALMYFSLISSIKISILLMYRRIFAVPSFRMQSLVLGGFVILWWLVGSIATGVYCVPLKRFWMGSVVPGYCFDYNIFWMVMGSAEVLIDTIILILPIRMVLQLQLSGQSKGLVSGIFLLGSFVIITGIIRTIYGYKPGSQNVNFERAELWSSTHVGIAIVCACLPTFRPLFKLGTKAFTTFGRKYYSSQQRSAGQYGPINCWPRSKTTPSAAEIGSVDRNSPHGAVVSRGAGKEDGTLTDQIIVRERVDVEWSSVVPDSDSKEDISLMLFDKAYIKSGK